MYEFKIGVKFQWATLKFHIKFWTHTPQNMSFTDILFLSVIRDIFVTP